jgi:hypothetical protein
VHPEDEPVHVHRPRLSEDLFYFSFFRLGGRRKGFLRSLLTISRGTPPKLPCGSLPAGTTINCVLCSDFIVSNPLRSSGFIRMLAKQYLEPMLAQEFASAEKLNAIFTFLWKNHIELWEDNLHHGQRIGEADAGLRFEDRRSGFAG